MLNGMRKKKLCVQQHDISDCAIACLVSIARYYKRPANYARIRQLSETDQQGTNILGILEASKKIFLSARGVKGTTDSLSKVPLPAIAHVIKEGMLHHYVVIYRFEKEHLQIMDPAEGKIVRMKAQTFHKIWSGILVLFAPDEEFKRIPGEDAVWRRFLHLVKPHQGILLQSFMGAIIYSILGLSISVYVQKLIDYVLPFENRNLLNLMSMLLLIIIFFKILIGVIKDIFMLKIGQKIDIALIMGYYRHLFRLPQRFFDTMKVGEIISRVNDAIKIRHFISSISMEIMVNLLIVVFTLIFMFFLSWRIALLFLFIIPFYMGMYYVYNKFNRKNQRQIMEKSADLESLMVESLQSASTVKRFNIEEKINLKTELKLTPLLRSVLLSSKNYIFSARGTEALAGILTLLLLWVGSLMVLHQQFSAGTLLSFYALTGYLLQPISQLIQSNQSMQDALIAADRLFQIMDLECDKRENGNICLSATSIHHILFENVSFRYGTRRFVLHELSAKLEMGKINAIVGESGSGKSTIVSLILNQYNASSGRIRFGRYDIQYLNKESLQNMIGIVPQRIDLFSGTIAENIAIKTEEPDLQKVIDLIHMFNMQTIFEHFPQGLMTYIGENGMSLSGGEKQCVALLRALYHDPEILILDEATSALDPLLESKIRRGLLSFHARGKTIILIAHRLSTVTIANKIVVLKNGRVMEEGTHTELLQKEGYYYNMWDKQHLQCVSL